MQKLRVTLIGLLILTVLVSATSTFALTHKTIKQAQEEFKELGYEPVSIDGVVGDNIRSAITKCPIDNGLSVKGILESNNVDGLGLQSAANEKWIFHDVPAGMSVEEAIKKNKGKSVETPPSTSAQTLTVPDKLIEKIKKCLTCDIDSTCKVAVGDNKYYYLITIKNDKFSLTKKVKNKGQGIMEINETIRKTGAEICAGVLIYAGKFTVGSAHWDFDEQYKGME